LEGWHDEVDGGGGKRKGNHRDLHDHVAGVAWSAVGEEILYQSQLTTRVKLVWFVVAGEFVSSVGLNPCIYLVRYLILQILDVVSLRCAKRQFLQNQFP
jgi:hypothetical protein